MVRVALITGITGQDGSYLAELLLDKGYHVYGLVRRHSSIHTERIDHIYKRLRLIYGDMTDQTSLFNAFHTIIRNESGDNSDFERLEVYNLAAQSHVKVSFEVPEYTAQTDALGTLRLLEVIHQLNLGEKVRFYQASTSELFGEVLEIPQTETTPLNPKSPYAVAKMYAFYIVKNYREREGGLFACNGILFNHTSPRRGETFVERKISIAVSNMFAHGIENCDNSNILRLGNINASRDIGHARDYVEGMWMMLQHDKPDDFVLATGETMTVREMVEIAFEVYGKRIEWRGEGVDEKGYCDDVLVVEIDQNYFRPAEVNFLLGDATKANEVLGWKPKMDMYATLRDVFENEKVK